MVCEEDPLVQKVCDLYDQISSLESLKPSKHVDMLFTQLVLTCISPPHNPHFDVNNLCKRVQEIRSKLIRLCGTAEGLLETHFSDILASFQNPLHHLNLFPYYSNYLKLSLLEFNILNKHSPNHQPTKIAFLGSGPLPLTSIVLATKHLTSTSFHNYDLDPVANFKAFSLVSLHPDLSKRMFFHTSDVLSVTDELREYGVVFLAALVGMDKEEKLRVIHHLSKFMSEGAYLMLRSAHGARAFLYPVVEPCDLVGFEILSVYHPTDDVINSVIIARKILDYPPLITENPIDRQNEQQELFSHMNNNISIMPNKCSEIQASFNPVINHGNMIEELAIEE